MTDLTTTQQTTPDFVHPLTHVSTVEQKRLFVVNSETHCAVQQAVGHPEREDAEEDLGCFLQDLDSTKYKITSGKYVCREMDGSVIWETSSSIASYLSN
jgi:hypothetical protein